MMACVEPLFAALLAVVFLSQVLSTVEWIGFYCPVIHIFVRKI